MPLPSYAQSKLAALAEEAQMAQAASSAHLEWPPGQRHPVRHERVKLALHQAAEFGAQIDKVRGGLRAKAGSAEGWGVGVGGVKQRRRAREVCDWERWMCRMGAEIDGSRVGLGGVGWASCCTPPHMQACVPTLALRCGAELRSALLSRVKPPSSFPQVMDADADAALEARLSLYDRAINALAEAKSHVRNAAKSLAGGWACAAGRMEGWGSQRLCRGGRGSSTRTALQQLDSRRGVRRAAARCNVCARTWHVPEGMHLARSNTLAGPYQPFCAPRATPPDSHPRLPAC